MIQDVLPSNSSHSSDSSTILRLDTLGYGAQGKISHSYLGRVGEAGQFHLDPFGTNLGAAVRQFEQKFRQKTKLAFEDRHVEPKSGISSHPCVNPSRSLYLHRTIVRERR